MVNSLRRPRAEYKALFALMIPIILQNVATNSLGLIDTLMVGILGQNELGGLNQANTVFFVFQLFTFGIMSGGSVLLGQYWGKKDIRAMNRVMGMSVYMSAGVSSSRTLSNAALASSAFLRWNKYTPSQKYSRASTLTKPFCSR